MSLSFQTLESLKIFDFSAILDFRRESYKGKHCKMTNSTCSTYAASAYYDLLKTHIS